MAGAAHSDQPLDLEAALTLLGLAEAPAGAQEVVTTLRAGRDVRLAADHPSPASTALLAGLCTAGTTLWVVDLPPLERVRPAPTHP